MQVFLIGYILIEICEIFTVGKFPLKDTVRIVGSSSFEDGTKLTRDIGLYWNTSGPNNCNSMDFNAQCGCGIPITR